MPDEKPFYYQVERTVSSFINALRSGNVATAEAAFVSNTLTPDAIARSAMFPPSLFGESGCFAIPTRMTKRLMSTLRQPSHL